LLVVTGWWPPELEFETRDLATVIDVLSEQAKEAKRARKH